MDKLGDIPCAFARNCTARRIDKITAAEFLSASHKFGDAAARFRYGLFVDRSTGSREISFPKGTLVAVATFSSGRRMRDGSRSYEWVRYASSPGIRVVGGMGKLLDTFVQDVGPDDVMSYSPEQCGDGDSYLELGFEKEDVITSESGAQSVKFRKRF